PKTGTHSSFCNRYFVVRSNSTIGTDARNHLDDQTVLFSIINLRLGTSKHHGITPFESNDISKMMRQFHVQAVYFILRVPAPSPSLSHEYLLGIGSIFEQFVIDQ